MFRTVEVEEAVLDALIAEVTYNNHMATLTLKTVLDKMMLVNDWFKRTYHVQLEKPVKEWPIYFNAPLASLETLALNEVFRRTYKIPIENHLNEALHMPEDELDKEQIIIAKIIEFQKLRVAVNLADTVLCNFEYFCTKLLAYDDKNQITQPEIGSVRGFYILQTPLRDMAKTFERWVDRGSWYNKTVVCAADAIIETTNVMREVVKILIPDDPINADVYRKYGLRTMLTDKRWLA